MSNKTIKTLTTWQPFLFKGNFISNFSWSEGGSNSQSLGRQSSVLPLSQIPSLRSMFDSLMLFIAKELIPCNDWIKTIQGTNDS